MRTHKRKVIRKKTHKRTNRRVNKRSQLKRGRVATRKMRGGETLINYEEYPKSFSIIDKYKQKKERNIYKKQIENICNKILGYYKEFQPDYRFLPVDKRELLKQEFVRELQKYRILLGGVDENTEEETGLFKKLKDIYRLPNDSPKKEKLLIDATNETNHYHNLIDTLRQCYEKYTDIVIKKDSAGQDVGSLNPRSSSKSKSKSPEYMNIKDDSLVSNYSIFSNRPPPLPPVHSDDRTNRMAGRMRSERPAPPLEEPRRRPLFRTGEKPVPVLPEYTAALDAIADLDKFLSSERKKMSK